MYQHWSFGKHFLREEHLYRKGRRGLAYELVINSNPCITYLMEENTMAMQALVTAHAAFGHNHFFKNNYLFRQWTDAGAILGYLDFAKSYIAKCEERHGTGRGRGDPRFRACADGAGRVPLPPPAAAVARKREQAARRASGWNTRSTPSATSGGPCRRRRTASAAGGGTRRDGRAAAGARTCRRKTCSTSSRRTARCWSRGSAKSCGSCA